MTIRVIRVIIIVICGGSRAKPNNNGLKAEEGFIARHHSHTHSHLGAIGSAVGGEHRQ